MICLDWGQLSASAQYKASCESVMTKIGAHAPFATANCQVHTYLYRRHGYRNMKVKPIELKGCYQQVNSLYRNVAYAFYKERSFTRLAVRICVLITIFETKLIPCCNVGKSVKSSMVRKSHDPNVANALASDMDNLVKSCISTLYERFRGNVDSNISSELETVGFPNQQRFRGTAMCSDVLDMLKTLQFSLTYPTGFDNEKKTCTIRVAICYSPYQLRLDGSGEVDVSPQLVGGFEVTVAMPFNRHCIRNPLHSPALGRYWRKELDRVGLTSSAIVGVAERAWDRVIGGTTMSLEAHLKNIKTQNSRYQERIKNIPSLFMTRWEESKEDGVLMAAQIRGHGAKMRRREAQTLIREEDVEPIWQRGTHATSGPLWEYWKKMESVLDAAMILEHGAVDGANYHFTTGNVASMHRVLEYASSKFEGENISEGPFYQWHRGERKKMLPPAFTQLIEEMYEKYITGRQRYPTGTRISKVFFAEDSEGEPQSFLGTVVDYDVGRGVYKVVYDDDDWEELFEEGLSDLIVDNV